MQDSSSKTPIRRGWFIAIFILAVALIVIYICIPGWHQGLVFVAAVIGGSAALITAMNALDTRIAQVLQAKKAASLHFVERWNDPQSYHLKKNGREIILELRGLSNVKDQKEALEKDKARLSNLIDVLNFFEELAVAIRTELADEELSRLFFRSILVEYWHSTEAFIRLRRSERENTRLMKEMEWLFDKWKN